jgi:hypothetical protein
VAGKRPAMGKHVPGRRSGGFRGRPGAAAGGFWALSAPFPVLRPRLRVRERGLGRDHAANVHEKPAWIFLLAESYNFWVDSVEVTDFIPDVPVRQTPWGSVKASFRR